ncbi:MAG: DNA topology modulation protein FlaR [Deltaproteobacteria bacterium]|nr:DNA topology modulation protein FlaR [Deltaproteobacteria bacterium]
MKIYIIGAAGSGKTTLAKTISETLNVKTTNLDEIFWSNTKEGYGIKRDIEERNIIYDEILQHDSWIIEGAYIQWPRKGFYLADEFVFLNLKESTVSYRIIKRFFLRKLNIEKSNKKETFSSLVKLIKWNMKQVKIIRKFCNTSDTGSLNVREIKNEDDIKSFLKSLIKYQTATNSLVQ